MQNNLPNTKIRFPLVDYIRGVAIILMIIFHGAYDLNLFGFVEIDFFRDRLWFVFPRVIVTLFMLAVGSGLYLAHGNIIKWKPFWRRFIKLAVCAVAITIGTYFIFPHAWVYFGTLHSIALCSLLALPLLKYPKLSLAIAALLIIPHLFFGVEVPWILMPHKSMDYIPPFPWVGVVLLGSSATHYGLHKWNPGKLRKNFALRSLEYLGIHSLIVYMIHQPLLYILAWGLYKFTG
jgi:uncharacterized membrane protein